MRASLARWVGDADAVRHLEYFRVSQAPIEHERFRVRADDYYLALVGELFERMRDGYDDPVMWARLGNAFSQFAAEGVEDYLEPIGVSASEALLYAAAAFYYGGFPASAYLTIRGRAPVEENEAYRACFDLLGRPSTITSATVRRLLSALQSGDLERISAITMAAEQQAATALTVGPNDWIPARLLEQLLRRFGVTNIRIVLPDGSSGFWDPLVASFLTRTPPAWEFFPSQIQAIQQGLLERSESFSLQMPTGAGKTTLCETLLYFHLVRNPQAVAVLLVPYRSLASELRTTLVRRLNGMGISARCAYGGTVPSGDEVRNLEATRAMVATPEALSGLLSANPDFFRRITLVVCDEGHLLDGGARGVNLELLLSRMRSREDGAPRFVFVSAIVPNIEEINAWLGGQTDSVVRSDYRPALAEFSVLRQVRSGSSLSIALDMHPHEAPPTPFSVDNFLRPEDFQWENVATGRRNTTNFRTIKTQAVAAARKALAMGAVAVFAANKRGRQGAVGLAEELLEQLEHPLSLPEPISFADSGHVEPAASYLALEYGNEWVGTRALSVGAVLHHGDIPQETREVIEALVRQGDVRLAICTNTLAEGVNLPIRTLVLYSVERRGKEGTAESLLARDIKNLVGRAGRAGSTTKGLVICANARQWPLVERVARQAHGERLTGALRSLIERLRSALARQERSLSNAILEGTPGLYTLIDGVDATLIDLAAEELSEEQLVRLAIELADQTFASQQVDDVSKTLLQNVFELRARRVAGINAAGKLRWIRETGARARMLDTVENDLLPRRPAWDNVIHATDPELLTVLLQWAWSQLELTLEIRDAYRLPDDVDINSVFPSFAGLVASWLSGLRFVEIADRLQLSIDDLLSLHARVLTFVLQTIVEQGTALLEKVLLSQGQMLAPAVLQFPEHLRFGVPTTAGRILASGGLRHRSAAVALGTNVAVTAASADDTTTVFSVARQLLLTDRTRWTERLGGLVFDNTLQDLASVINGNNS